MSIPPLPEGVEASALSRAANALHSLSIHILRSARAADRETGLTRERLSILSVLVYAGPRTVSALAAIEDVSAPAISRSLSALADAKLVRRAPTKDKREVLVSATAKGRRLVEAGRKRRLSIVASELKFLPGADLRTLAAIADRIEARRDGLEERRSSPN
jgi:DNA-binding MarR family transcriptional regulator